MARYINSADALNTLKQLLYETALNQFDFDTAVVFEDIAKNRLETWVDLIPTADVVERKKGTWIDNDGLYQCSACKHIWSELWWVESCPMDRMNKLMRYCPSCGADMRKETEDAVH